MSETLLPAPRIRAAQGKEPPAAGVADIGEAGEVMVANHRERRAALRREIEAGVPAAVRRQHSSHKLTARERLALLLDDASFTEIGIFRRAPGSGPGRPHTDGVVTGWGTVNGRRVFVYAQDFTVSGGSLGPVHADKIQHVLDLALQNGAPVIGLNDSGGARIQDGAQALDGFGGIFRRNVQASGVIPQISVIMGPCAGGAAYSPALTDFTFMVRRTAYMYLTGPDVVAAVTGERVDHEELGGAEVHSTLSGVASFVCDSEEAALEDVRYLLSMLPANNLELPPAVASRNTGDDDRPALADIVPVDPRQPYDMGRVIAEIVDDGDFMQVHENWAKNVICALARIDGQVVGLVANQPLVLAGVLDGEAAEKAARFVRFCDAFNVPLVSLVDVPGFLPGIEQEHAGVIRSGAKLLYAYCEATVPRIQVILRKAYGGAYIVMDSRSVGADLSLAWPANEIAVMGADAAVNVIHRRELASADDSVRLRAKLAAEYRDAMMSPDFAVERGLVDDIVDPAATRTAVIGGLRMLSSKRVTGPHRKHGNGPQ